jgi:hypothetical protein
MHLLAPEVEMVLTKVVFALPYKTLIHYNYTNFCQQNKRSKKMFMHMANKYFLETVIKYQKIKSF